MKNIVDDYIREFREKHREKFKYLGIMLVLGITVVGIIMWRFHFTGIALSNEMYCGLEEHIHIKECYDWVLTSELKNEDQTEADATLTRIENEAIVASNHTCVGDDYETLDILVCGKEENEEHTHSLECYEKMGSIILTSEMEENEGHVYTDDCYNSEQIEESDRTGQNKGNAVTELSTETEEVEKNDAWYCENGYVKVLICDMEEHIHTIECQSDEIADRETAADWETTLPELTGILREDVVNVAISQLGYMESVKNFILANDGETRIGYTRYGAWYGNEYGNWDAMFVAFCLYYAGIPEENFPVNISAWKWMVQLQEINLFVEVGDNIPVAGDIAFIDTNGDGKANRVAIIESVEKENQGVTILHVIEGNYTSDEGMADAVCMNDYAISEGDSNVTILGYGIVDDAPKDVETENDDIISFDTESFSTFTVAASIDVLAIGDCEDNLVWTLTSDGVLTISGIGEMNNYSSGTAPWYGYRSEITSVVIESGVTSIGNFAFSNCYGLENIEIPAGVMSLGAYVFQNCISLKTLIFAEDCSLTSIPQGTFYGCTSLGYITIPDSITSIGTYAFLNCTNLKKVYFIENSKLTMISTSAFYGCTSLSEINIPNTVTRISQNAFYGCESLASITIPDSVTSILTSAFYGCTKLTTVTFAEENMVTTIGNTAFYGCTSLSEIIIPKGVTSIGTKAFYGCSSLQLVAFADPTVLINMGASAFATCMCLSTVNGKTTVDDVIKIFAISVDKGVFAVTNLYGISLAEDSDNDSMIVIGNVNTTGLEMVISVTKNSNTVSSVAQNEFYTGVPAYTDISISSGSAETAAEYIARIYVWFEDSDGTLSLMEGTHTYNNTPVYVTAVSGFSNLYCIEIKGSEWGGDTISFDFNTMYPNLTSNGGYVWIFGEVISVKDVAKDYWPTGSAFSYHEIFWKTEPNEFQVNKEITDAATFSSEGTGNENVYLTSLVYEVSFTGTSVTKEGQGKDLIKSVEFFDTLNLPDTIKWRDGLITAVQQGNYYINYAQFDISTNRYTNPSVYVTVDGVSYLLCTVSNTGSNRNIYDVSLYVENGEVVLHWTMKNTSIKTEISLNDTVITFGDRVILVSDESILKAGVGVSVANKIKTTEHYTYSADSSHEAFVTKSINMGAGRLILNKKDYENEDKNSDYSYYLGESVDFQIIASNPEALPYSGLRYIYDQLTEWMYITPDEIQKLFEADIDDRNLTITLKNATLCNVEKVYDAVKNTDGKSITLTQQQEGEVTDYETNEKIKDISLITAAATITFSWNSNNTNLEDGSWLDPFFQMIVSYDIEDDEGNVNSVVQYTRNIGVNGDYTTVEESLDDIGYVVTYGVEYTLCWDLGENFLLYGGQTLTYEYNAEVKDSFMILTGDQPWYYVDGTNVAISAELNAVEAQNSEKETLEKDTVIANRLYRDFQLYKEDTAIIRKTRASEELEWETIWEYSGTVIDDSVDIQPGDVIEYTVDVLHGGGAAYDALPLIDRLSGSQYLLIPVSLNIENRCLSGLEIVTVQGVDYYILSQVGTYNDVFLQAGFLVDEIILAFDSSRNLTETMIYSYLSVESTESVQVIYRALVQTDEESLAAEFELRNQVWLNNHETHRIYDEAFREGSVFEINKYIVMDKGEEDNFDDDVLAKRTTLTQAEEVTYRFTLRTVGDAYVTLNGSSIWDVLPENVKGDVWKEEDIVSIDFVAASGTKMQDNGSFELKKMLEAWSTKQNGDNASGWYITSENPSEATIGVTDPETQQFLCWSKDLSMTYNGTIYVYVTLKFPVGEAWQEYGNTYEAGNLENILHVFQLKDTVFHDVEVETSAYLQKGVEEIGVYTVLSSAINLYRNVSENARQYYENDSTTYCGYAKYYVVLCNEGPNNMYLNDLQDILPEGFTYLSNTISGVVAECVDTDYMVELSTGMDATLKTFSIGLSTEETVSGRQKVIFHLYDYESEDNLSYDSWLDKYYLEPGEAVVFTFYVSTNEYENTENYASNVIAMPFYDYTGGGVSVISGVSVNLGIENDIQDRNDGDCDVQGVAWAAAQEMDVSCGDNLWLSSDVVVHRTEIKPGITKSTSQTIVDDSTVVEWTLTVTNSGNATMTNYTITDVMENPYTFFGDIKYKIMSPSVYAFGTSENYGFNIETTLFSLGERSTENGKTIVELAYKGDTSGSDVKTALELNGDAVTISCIYTATNNVNYSYDIEVSLFQDNYKNEILQICFMDDFMSIASGGQGVMTLSTKPDTYTHVSRVYYNNCYITPNEQTFNSGTVSQGNYVNSKTDSYMQYPSVRNASQVATTSGSATSSIKKVEEVGNSLNNASSDALDTSGTYITLPSGDTDFMYTLSVTNGESGTVSAMTKLVLIDRLPDLEDTYVFGTTQRASQFKVVLASNPEFIVEIGGQNVDESEYKIEFSTATSFTDGDWINTDTETKWLSWINVQSQINSGELTLEDIRSFRVVFNTDNTSTLLPSGATVTIQFIAKVADDQGDLNRDGEDEHASSTDISASAIAWNSFGYCYSILGSSTNLKAAPLKVGVQIPSAPELVKQLQNSDGTEVAAESDEIFRYLIYRSDDAFSDNTMEDWKDETELIVSLKAAGVDTYTIIEVKVGEGESESDVYSLCGLHEYSTHTSNMTGNLWEWMDNVDYTIVEIGSASEESEYEFSSWNSGVKSNNFTFTYRNNFNVQLICVNKKPVWSLTLTKVNESYNVKLPGAVFGLYSRNALSLINEEDVKIKLKDVLSITKLKYNNIKELKISGNSGILSVSDSLGTEKWYLIDIQVTGADGTVSWDGFSLDDEYYLVELEAPDNYFLNEEESWYVTYQGVALHDDSVSQWSVSSTVDGNGLIDYSVYGIVTNAKNQYNLPKSGGTGTELYTLTGLFFVIVAACLRYKKLRREGR